MAPSPTSSPTATTPAPLAPQSHDAAPTAAAQYPGSAPDVMAASGPTATGLKRKATAPPAAVGMHNNAQRGRSFLNHQQRLEIIKKKDEEPNWTQVQLARWAAVHFGLPKEPSQATIAVLLKKRDELKAATVRPQTRTIRSPRHPQLEDALLLWVRYLQSKKVAFTGENIRLKAAALATQLGLTTTLNFSTGWMSGFVSRHNLVLARAHKKKQTDSDDEPARAVLKHYEPRNVFALYETALVYNDLPFDGDHDAQAGPDRDRVCVGLAVNADASEKLAPLVVTTCRRRQKLGGVADTFYNMDSNMTTRIFEQWLYKLNQRMAAAHRKIVMVVNAEPSHFPIQLTHVRLVVLPSAAPVLLHPLEGSVTKCFKALYRKTHLSFAVDQAEDGRASRVLDVSLSRALIWIKQAWLDVPVDLIRSGWTRTGLIAAARDEVVTPSVEIPPEVVQSLVVSLSQLQLLESMPMETLLSSESEDDPHYIYDDATVVRVVAGGGVERDGDDDGDAEPDDEVNGADERRAGLASDITSFPSQTEAHVLETEPTTNELLANYRGVIWSLDAEPERTDDHNTALRFLRQKQAALRVMQQQQNRSATSSENATPVDTADPSAPSEAPL